MKIGRGSRRGGARIGMALMALVVLVAPLALDGAEPAAGAKSKAKKPKKAKAAKPNLKVTKAKVKGAETAVPPGAKLQAGDTTANAGKAKAAKSTTRFYLTRDVKASLAERKNSKTDPRSALADLLLFGDRTVPELGAGKRSKAKKKQTQVTLPATTPSGSWFLLACADDGGKLKESSETDNCKAAKEPVVVSGGGPVGSMQTYAASDAFERDQEFGGEELIDLDRPEVCTPDAKLKQLSAAKALKSIDRLLRKRAGKAALKAFARSPEAKSFEAASNVAAAALLEGEPGAALVAITRAHQLKKKDALTLVNAAVVATTVGLPSEALALLEQAATLDPPKKGPHLSFSAQLALARGHAYGAAGRWSEAEAAARAGQALEPYLTSEAANILAAAKLCKNDKAAAVSFRRRSKVRNEPPPTPPVDESAGKSSEMRNVPFPALPKNAVAMAPFFVELSQKIANEGFNVSQQESALLSESFDKDENAAPVVGARRQGMLTYLYRLNDQQRFKSAYQPFLDRVDGSHEVRYAFFGDGQDSGKVGRFQDQAFAACESAEDWEACFESEMRSRCRPALRSDHQAWLNEITGAYLAAKAWYRQISKAASGVGAQFSGDPHHRLAMLNIAEHELGPLGLIAQSAHYWTHNVNLYKQYCVEDPEPPTGESPEGAPRPNDPGPCPPELSKFKVKATIAKGVTAAGLPWEVGISGNCDEVAAEAQIEVIPWIQAFGNISHARKSGETTLVLGPRAEISKGGAKASFESTLYVKHGPNRTESGLVDYDNPTIVDVGWRGGPSSGVSSPGGLVEYSGPSDLVSVSFFGGFALAR